MSGIIPQTTGSVGAVEIRALADCLGFDLLDANDDWLGVHIGFPRFCRSKIGPSAQRMLNTHQGTRPGAPGHELFNPLDLGHLAYCGS